MLGSNLHARFFLPYLDSGLIHKTTEMIEAEEAKINARKEAAKAKAHEKESKEKDAKASQ
jgi:hypothetical protein